MVNIWKENEVNISKKNQVNNLVKKTLTRHVFKSGIVRVVQIWRKWEKNREEQMHTVVKIWWEKVAKIWQEKV